MGKNLKGKELGVGISQRSDGLYVARFTKKNGVRIQKCFKGVRDAKKWLADSKYEDEHGKYHDDITVKDWCEIWSENKKKTVRITTYNNYMWAKKYIVLYIGDIKLSDVKPLMIQDMINNLGENGLKDSSLRRVKHISEDVFQYALENCMITRNPVVSFINCKCGNESVKRESMTISEHKKFIELVSGTRYEDDFLFVLETGLRYGELVGLRWCDVDLDKKMIFVRRNLRYVNRQWEILPPKTTNSIRGIPLSRKAISILRNQKIKNRRYHLVEKWSDLVFPAISGLPVQNDVYGRTLRNIGEEIGMKTTLSMHVLRHTFATRCIECGMMPKTLQMILGHSDIQITMNLYVHTTDETKLREIDKLESALAI